MLYLEYTTNKFGAVWYACDLVFCSNTLSSITMCNTQELLDDVIDEDEQIPWALTAKREIVQSMSRYEIQRQENIKELVYTERTHLQKLKIMRYVSMLV